MSRRQTRPTFRQRVQSIAQAALRGSVPPQQLTRAVSEVALAFAAAHRSARDPSALEACTDESIGACIARAAISGLMPGGSPPLAHLVPQRPRKGAPPELQLWPTAIGYAALAYEDSGLVLMAIPVHVGDHIVASLGETLEHVPGEDGVTHLDDLAGVYITIRRAADGIILHRPWISGAIIRRRAEQSKRGTGRGTPWGEWPAEMAIGAAIRYAYRRGYIPSTSTRLNAAMSEPEIIDADAQTIGREVAPARTAHGPALAETRAPESHMLAEDPFTTAPMPEREPVTVERRPEPEPEMMPADDGPGL